MIQAAILGFGVVGNGIHAKTECADISSLTLSAKMLALAALHIED